ncbi:MAG: hypothetical protein QM781_20160 [Chitinophagaceae bacterium]
MKRILLIFVLAIVVSQSLPAQRVRVQLDFPIGIAVRAPGLPPFRGAIWVGPEWRWQRGHYVAAPGYWTRSRHAYRSSGYWKHTRRGYVWVPGRWRR